MKTTVCNRHYVDGEWALPVSPGDPIPVISPVTEAEIGTVTPGGAADVDRAVAAARRAFPAFSTTTPGERVELLKKILELLEARAEDFAQAITFEMGSCISFSRSAQVPFGIAHIRTAIEVLESFEFLRRQGTTAIVREPIGVCGLITPWNWPLYQITAKVAPALATGCTMVLKPSELSPFSAQLFAEVLDEAGVPAGVFNMVPGTGPGVGAPLSAHADVDMVSITGSTRAGIAVAKAAGRGGGARPRRRYGDEETGMGPLANIAQFGKVRAMIEIGIGESVRLACGGPGRPE